MTKEAEFYAQFQRGVANHKLTILRNDGVYRHIKCADPKTGICHFEILTWPGYLAYVGDMGAFTFWRLEDMFEFFRSEPGEINPGYWGQKLEAVDKCDGASSFDCDYVKEQIKEEARQSLELEDGEPIPEDALEELRPMLDAEDEHELVSEMRNFSYNKLRLEFCDISSKSPTHRFLWCCHAIVWAINEWDKVNL